MAGFLSFLTPIRDRYFKEGDAEGAYRQLEPWLHKKNLSREERRAVYELAGLIHRSQKRYKEAVKLYKEIGDDYQAGYCELLQGNLQAVKPYWTRLLERRQNHWCVTLYGMVTRQLATFPTTFQIRNHLESDIANLLAADQLQFLENLLTYGEFLIQLNLETYKFMGRSLMLAGWQERAGTYLFKSQKTLPNDPEIYYHLGEYLTGKNQPEDARLMLHQCLLISPTYYPAKALLKSIAA